MAPLKTSLSIFLTFTTHHLQLNSHKRCPVILLAQQTPYSYILKFTYLKTSLHCLPTTHFHYQTFIGTVSVKRSNAQQLPPNCYYANFWFRGFTRTPYITFDATFIKYLPFVILMNLSADGFQFLCLSVLNKILPIF